MTITGLSRYGKAIGEDESAPGLRRWRVLDVGAQQGHQSLRLGGAAQFLLMECPRCLGAADLGDQFRRRQQPPTEPDVWMGAQKLPDQRALLAFADEDEAYPGIIGEQGFAALQRHHGAHEK
ncbi:MAG: hypothetical protein WD396_01140 [Pseudohongiellaceae bacterium]